MTDRERLVELIELSVPPSSSHWAEVIADELLADGWIRPPCKVGDVVWYLNKHPHIALFQNSVYKAKVVRLVTISTGTVIVIQIKSEGCCEIPDESDWGITLFASREEAEKALKGGER